MVILKSVNHLFASSLNDYFILKGQPWRNWFLPVLCSFQPQPWLMAMGFIVDHLSLIFNISIITEEIGPGHCRPWLQVLLFTKPSSLSHKFMFSRTTLSFLQATAVRGPNIKTQTDRSHAQEPATESVLSPSEPLELFKLFLAFRIQSIQNDWSGDQIACFKEFRLNSVFRFL